MSRYFRPVRWAWALAWTAMAAVHAAPATLAGSQAGMPHYASAFERYRAFADQPVRPWAQVNEEVHRIGGWRAYAREANDALEPVGPAAVDAADERSDRGHHRH
ncbi:hypothetical protein M8A51_12580 [Schlegelella sp. S2-27]|uniref:Uncharacterized protein n=1 Tax=Caldimonas mangrovi TaxID=2944811 RepID=A0ABT0YNS3_9BURK|nr:hypothetical protein [Caldimonas mangrovi]MCM5680366.1 hypothetical protein [Caldimonas mangrovi]